MIATRHLPGLAALLAVACIPTILHSYIGATVGDGRSTAALPFRLNELEGRASGRSPAWVLDMYGATDFIERHYGRDLTLFVARSFDAKRLYHHPEHGVARGDGYDRAVIVRPAGRPDVPIFLLKGAQERMSAYALLYDGRFVANTIEFELRRAITSLVRPRTQMTLFFARGRISDITRPNDFSSVEGLLLAAIDSFVAQRGTEPE